jgi:GAF domain-containing protein
MLDKSAVYADVLGRISSLVQDEVDAVSIMATISCELFHAFDHFHWVGFYRRVDQDTLKVGPYQGGHGCLQIALDRGVCGACARTGLVQIENDITLAQDHIACSAKTKAEIVLPVKNERSDVVAVLDIDSTELHVFDYVDVGYLREAICLLAPSMAQASFV